MNFSAQTGSTTTLLCSVLALLLSVMGQPVMATDPIPVMDASLSAAFYSDSSCLLTIDSNAQPGKTIIDADVDNDGSRMLIHCDTDDGRRLTLLARGDSLNVSQLVPLLTREEIEEGELGMIAWLTRSGVHYADDSVPRRYVIAGSVLLRKSPPLQVAGNALHSQRHAFGRVTGMLEPLLRSRSVSISEALPVKTQDIGSADDPSEETDEKPPRNQDKDKDQNQSETEYQEQDD
ncbi:hypothetical protein [Granulosicoccus antarcticus]|uniref:Uncharacterized protein n=1 Tax=Granulosicoccus antarcticus IMCC3135 TaxID=1192854 RepID=A0A2Z2NPD3_9GAMM|nr:hypothetical protein [Granulosicoccus antarcticus]ASJ71528.1 hypothetical protein IMCC3135_07110 [Granulosicoccus antarcticus IMCC3135]